MLFKRIIEEEIKNTIQTKNPLTNQSLIDYYGFEFVKKWKEKIDVESDNQNSIYFYSIFFYFLNKRVNEYNTIPSKYDFAASDVFQPLSDIIEIYKKDNYCFNDRKKYFEYPNLRKFFRAIEEPKKGIFSTITYNTNNEIQKTGHNTNDYGDSSKRKYEDFEITTFQIMAKNVDLFPKVTNITQNTVNIESVDIQRFRNDFEKANNFILLLDLWFPLEFILKQVRLDDINYGKIDEYYRALQGKYNFITKHKPTPQQKQHIDFIYKLISYQITICKLFQKNLNKFTEKITLDRNFNNFGYRRGTKEIVNFDPIHNLNQ